MQGHRESEKARRYLELLDAARCNGRWQEVPELVRKISKHAPHRTCLTLVAQSEWQVAAHSSKRPTTSFSDSTSLPQLIPALLNAIEDNRAVPEDVFQAQTCLGWLHWTIGEPSLALSRLPSNIPQTFSYLRTSQETLAGWTHVCAVKGAYIRGASQEIVGNPLDVARTYESTLPYISDITATSGGSPEQRLWTERLLTRFCMLTGHDSLLMADKLDSTSAPTVTLAPFRAWARFWEGRPGQGLSTLDSADINENLRRRHVWQAYYDIISKMLQSGSPYPLVTSNREIPNGTSSAAQYEMAKNPRLQQSTELRRVEATYEGLLLKEVQFPEADRANTEVDHWVDQVMANWRVICGPMWRDEDLGQGGQESAARNVLDILYRAATKTFHSTPILRYLFTLHASLAEFDLAGRALDSYMDIVGKGMTRADKSGETGFGLDNDETALHTAAAGVSMLCTFGRRKEAEKAQNLTIILKKWIRRHQSGPSLETSVNTETPLDFREDEAKTISKVSGKALAAAYRAIGISQAHWARLTFEASERAELQANAIACLRHALRTDLDDEDNIETLYALALALAETRDLEAAIITAKTALSIESQSYLSNGSTAIGQRSEISLKKNQTPKILSQRRLIKVWHLLALLLSARQDFDTSEASCEAVLDDFTESEQYEGDPELSGLTNSMGFYAKQNLIEIKMTQLALTEVSEGPEVAVNAGGELLGLYAHLFKSSVALRNRQPISKMESPPRTSSGTMRSFRESFLGRSKALEQGHRTKTATSSVPSQGSSIDLAHAPTISVTNEDDPSPRSATHHLFHHNSKKLQKRNSRRSMASMRRSRGNSPATTTKTNEAPSSNPRFAAMNLIIGDSKIDESEDTTRDNSLPYASDRVGIAVSHNMPPVSVSPTDGTHQSVSAARPLPAIAHNYNEKKQPAPLSHSKQPPNQDIRLPVVSPHSSSSQPEPRFAEVEQQRHELSVLLKIWLLIAGLYRRARMYDDAKGALDEAFQHVRSVEAAVATRQSSAQAFTEPGWGGVKSVEELWADVYTENGNLDLARLAPHDAMIQYESALSHFPDHPAATVGLSNILLDIYSKKVPSQPSTSSLQRLPSSSDSPINYDTPHPVLASLSSSTDDLEKSPRPPRTPVALGLPSTTESNHSPPPTVRRTLSSHSKTPEALNRLAARDRAYGLLSSLTKLGTGWDNSEAWFALARAYEEGGQLDRAKEVLWWVVELEEKRPIRGWECLGQGYSL